MKWGIIITCVIVVLILIKYGLPSDVTIKTPIVDATWGGTASSSASKPANVDQKDIEPKTPKSKISTASEITIEQLETTQTIYQPTDQLFAKIRVNNPLNVSYTLIVDWLNGSNRFYGWSTNSTPLYNTSQQVNLWDSWFNASQGGHPQGDWEVHAIVKYKIYNQTHSTDKTNKFRVI